MQRCIMACAAAACALAVATPAKAAAPLPDRVTIITATCPDGSGAPACAIPDEGVVYVEPGEGMFVLEHEIGHVFDYQRLTDGDRHWFTRMLALSGDWDQGTGPEGLLSPKERFADAYAACALDWRPDRGEWASAYGYAPTLKRHRRICLAIRRIGQRAH